MISLKFVIGALLLGFLIYSFWPAISSALKKAADSTDLDEKAVDTAKRLVCGDNFSQVKSAVERIESELDPEDQKTFDTLKKKIAVKVFEGEK